MTRTSWARWALGAVGMALATYGGYLTVHGRDLADLVEIAGWLAAGVALHDAVVAGLVLAAAFLGRRHLPDAWTTPAAVAFVLWGTVTVTAIPVLGRFGARSDNPTLLDRPYLTSWLVLTLVTVVAVTVAGEVRRRRRS